MRRSAEEKAETRRQIVRAAGRMIRERGLSETCVADVMTETGLTHGGFYRHFESKEALAAAAVDSAFAHMRARLEQITAQAPAGKKLAALIETYLTEAHRDQPQHGCVMASVGMEAQRAGGVVQAAYEDGISKLLALFAAQIEAPTRQQRDDRSQVVLSVMVGGLLLARALRNDPAGSKRALTNARKAALAAAAG
ncbi:TetR/AcrR family transcriptional regulator [Ferrovibrio terrae]|uniref:TetR/AcrR family transcriptional regulator n=1 Tax=Ferrovibrio terrae TaxID=2594003 RepID=A0A516GXF7_9PROT|nr:TetR/AcrR family transcriptional regulator [Ferrovibrio terrae]QDO96187.1 TetR/AcrR family transcriptional regulator [Ferrovibrio terrae]